MAEAASATINGQAAGQSATQYSLTLNDTGSTTIGTFWFGWVPGEDFLATAPTDIVAPSGWTSTVTHEGPSDGYAVQFVANSPASYLHPGSSSSDFGFTSADTPAELTGNSTFYSMTPVTTSFVYSAGPFSDPGFEFTAAVTTAPSPSAILITSSGGLTSQPVQMISGTVAAAGAGTLVTVHDGTAQIGAAKVQADGNWSVGATLSSGVHTISASDTISSGDTVTSNNSIITVSATAPAAGILESLTPAEEIAGIYLGYFDRAPDAGGFSFWEGQYTQALAQGQFKDEALQNIANSFTPQPETLALYPFLSAPLNPNSPNEVSGVDNLIVSVYTNLFDRTPAVTDSGVQYWANQILSGAVPLGEAVLDIANGATGADANTVLNKIIVGDYFEAQEVAAGVGSTSPLPAALLLELHSILAGVTSDPSTVTAAETTASTEITASPAASAAPAPSASGPTSDITGTINNDTLIGSSAGGDIIYPAGGADTIALSPTSHASETIYFGATVNGATTAVEPITNAAGATQQGFWGNVSGTAGLSASTSADMSVVNNFAAGANGDIVGFVFPAWGSGGTVNGAGTELGLVQGDAATPVTAGSAVLGTVAAAGTTLAAAINVVVDSVATYANAHALATAVMSSTGHFVLTGSGLAAKDDAHLLVAYSDGGNVRLADVDLDNATGAAQADTANLTVAASDMVQLAGVSLAALAAHNIALVA